MKTARLLLGLTGILTTLAITATPAPAEFQANQPNTTQGPLQLKSGSPNPKFETGEGFVECSELQQAEWHIQTKFTKITKDGSGNTLIRQDQTKDGPHQSFSGLFRGCTANGGAAATVNSTCVLQIRQISTTVFRGGVKALCLITIPGVCTLKIAAGEPNNELEEVTATNTTEGQEAVSTVKGITDTVAGAGCAIAGIESTKGAKFKATVIAHSEKVF